MNFYSIAGQMALGSRLRRLADTLTSDAEQLYQLYGAEIEPRWFPVFYMLSQKKSAAITELAQDIGQSHPAISQVVQEMIKRDIAETTKCTKDARVNRVSLTPKGLEISKKLDPQCQDVDTAVRELLEASSANLWADIEAVEYELDQISFFDRVAQLRKQRESAKIELVPYHKKYQKDFKSLNINWITQYWELEASDKKALDHPQTNIIDQGGHILLAMQGREVVGTCALIKMDDCTYELAKMAVADSAKGLGIGTLLGESIIQKAKALSAKRLYLESNSQLQPALSLYRKLGFKKVSDQPSPYNRCDIQMEMIFE